MPVVLKDEDVIKEQMKTIGKLQDRINLLKFDNSRNSQLIIKLKHKLKSKNKILLKIKTELSVMVEQNNIEEAEKLLKLIKGDEDE